MKSCCILGHRKFHLTDALRLKIEETIIYLITEHNVSTFFFGSKSNFTDVCFSVITQLKNRYPKIKRVYIRAEYPHINQAYLQYLSSLFEDTYYYNKNLKSGKYNYIKRNQILVDKSDFCLFYYNPEYQPQSKTTSGTKLAYCYALKKEKIIFNLF